MIESKLEVARVVGADVVINCQQQNLKDEGMEQPLLYQLASIMLCITAVMRETNGDGIGRLVEATGATAMVNNSFSLLRLAATAVM